jgi:hypothetical protein
MKIVDYSTFMALPNGTVYCKYRNGQFEDICVKVETIKDHDFTYISTIDNLTLDKLTSIQNGDERYLDLTSCGRDGCFDKTQQFAIFHKWDVSGIILLLEQSINNGFQ